MMETGSSQEPPAKKRRFFRDPNDSQSDSDDAVADSDGPRGTVPGGGEQAIKEEDSHEVPHRPLPEGAAGSNGAINSESPVMSTSVPQPEPTQEPLAMSFDTETFEMLVGDKVKPEVLDLIRKNCGDSLERAVNMYFDGTYKKIKAEPTRRPSAQSPAFGSSRNTPIATPTVSARDSPIESTSRKSMPESRYIGAFGVEGWATRSGVNILKHGDIVKIERQKIQPPKPTKIKAKMGMVTPTPRKSPLAANRVDVIVRFTSQDGSEIGRLAKDAANWVSTLIDQKICKFEGTCVYAPERLRTSDTVFLQLRCSLLKSAFFNRRFQLADDRSNAFYEQTETEDEKVLRLRQVALVRLLQEVNLQPTLTNAASHNNREGLLQAAEMDEQKQKDEKKNGADGKDGGSGSPSDAEDGEELEQDQLDALYKKAQSFDFNTPEAEPADSFALQLRPYQKQALHWMMTKEKDEKSNREPSMHPLWEQYDWPTKDFDDKPLPEVDEQTKFYVNPYSGDLSLDFPAQEQHCLGGILADEMGLGKTIQMLSLVHSHRSELAHKARISNGGLSSVNQLPRLGANSTTVLQAPCTTLVIAPMSLLAQWQSEAEKASRAGTMKVELYYGPDKNNNLQALCCSANASAAPDVVITSYGIVLSEFSTIASKNGDKSFHNGIFSLNFFRVIIDEGHHIKNRASKTARACYEIQAVHRWVLTGTPIVNKLEDLFSLVRFLGVEPWNNFSFWKTFVTVPFEKGDFVRALDVVQTVLEPLVMRRTKDMKTPDGLPLVPLPPKHVEIVDIELSRTEREVYDLIFKKAKKTFFHNMEAGTVMKAYTTIFAQILRLRQTCCHPTLVRHRDIVADEIEAGAAADAAAGLADDMDLDNLLEQFMAETDEAAKDKQVYGAHALGEIRDEAEKECPLCFDEPMNDQLVTGCWHSACKKCILDYMRHETDRGVVPRCFNCREPLNHRDLFEVVRYDDEPDAATGKPRISLQRHGVNSSSAKVVALISHLRQLRREHPSMKSVVFSQFTSFLDLIQPPLGKANMNFVRLDGTMAQKARAAVLQEFTDAKGFTILLISLRAGGVGLNLTSAGRVFMMDPWWSFAVEAQAIDRVHRMGQEEEVIVKRFVVKDSVEQRMLRVQERKKFIATSLGMMSDEEKKVQRIEDIKELLS